MSINPLRKMVRKIGLDIHRAEAEVDRLAWLRKQDIRTVFDIGANVGQFAKELRHCLPNVQIYSFEPLKDCYERLQADFSGDTRFRAFNVAIGENRGSMIMNRSSYSPSSSLRAMAESHKSLFPHTRDNTPVETKIERLDDVYAELDPKPDILIKVDTQGYEDKVLAGGMHTFGSAKIVFIEASFAELYVGQPLFDDIYQKLKSLGFAYKGALHQKLNRKTGEVIFEDAIFIRKPGRP